MQFLSRSLKFCREICLQLSVLLFSAGALAAVGTAKESGGTIDSGAAVYNIYCAHCHGGKVAKAPPLSLLQIMSPGSIYRALDQGIMREQAADLSDVQKLQVAEHLTGQSRAVDTAVAPAPACEAGADWFDRAATPDQQGWGMDLSNRRYQSAQTAGLEARQIGELELKWVFAFPEAMRARSQPATAGGALFVGSQNGTVYALDQLTGCIHWSFQTVAEVRTAIVVQDWSQVAKTEVPLLFFGDLVGNVYALNALTGKLVWRDRPDEHPSLTLTAAPALHDGILYVPMSALEVTAAADPTYACCTFRGGVAAYQASTGERLWTGFTIDDEPREVGKNAVGTPRVAPSGSPVWNTPVIDVERSRLYLGTGENYSSPANETSDAILALSLEDGRILWHQQMTAADAWNMGCETEEKINCPPENGPDYDFGAATILARSGAGRELILAGQKSGDVYALDPDQNGKIIWQRKLGRGGIQGGVHFGMAVDGDTVYVPISDFDGGPRWPGTPRPGMYALDLETGATLWSKPATDVCEGREFCQPGLSAAATAIPGGVVAGAMDGHLRVYDKLTGKILLDIDTAVPYRTLNGLSANGGSFGGGAGPVFKNGMMFLSSGYGIYFHMPGNVLLAYGPASSPL